MSAPMSHNADSTGSVTPELTEQDLSDKAIEILYDIVRRTQSSSDRSEAALYNACDAILAERRLAGEYHGEDVGVAVLYKFLKLMQDRQRRGENLVQRYQRVMQDIHITVDVDENGDGVDVTTPFRIATKEALTREPQSRGYRRHGSFDSFLDGSADKIAGPTDTGTGLPYRSRRSSDGATETGVLEAQALVQHQGRLPIRTRKDVNPNRGRRASSGQQKPPPRVAGSVTGHDNLRVQRSVQPQPSGSDAESTSTSEFDFSSVQIPGVNSPIPNVLYQQTQSYAPEPFRPSDTRLLDDAETFENQRLHSLVRRCIQLWRQRAQEQIARNEEMERLATALDRKRLLKDSIGDLRHRSLQNRNDRETDRFFGKLERRAEKARDLFLLTKSFTHWARSAEDEVQRTSVARRHILRTRFFNGWREITAINELKIQHFVLSRFLNKWRRRMDEVTFRQEAAENMYDNKLARRVYRDWFFRYCERTAPDWRELRMKRVFFGKWYEKATVLKERDNWATDRKERQMLRRSLEIWRNRVTAVKALEPQSDQFRQRALLSSALSTLRKHATTMPLLSHFRTQSNARLAANLFKHWRRNTVLSRQAKAVDQMRLLRNAWTNWNDRLRIKALKERIDDRVLVEAMYRWALASRVSLFQRVHNQTVKESVFLTWITRTNERHNTLGSAERRFAQFKRTQLLRMSLRKLEEVTAERRAEEFAIKAQYEQKIKQRFLDTLIEKNGHLQQLNRWAEDARFFVFTTRTLKIWNAATQHARRNRRREAYSQMRRIVKINLVRRAFETWRAKAKELRVRENQVDETNRTRTLHYAAVLLAHMRDRTTTIRAQETEAQQYYINKLKSRYLAIWTGRLTTLQAKYDLAAALRQENTDLAGLTALKKLGWRLWNIQRQEETAIALYRRNFEKRQRFMIRYWHEQVIEKRATRSASPTPSRRTRNGRGSRGSGSQSDRDDTNNRGVDREEVDREANEPTPFDEPGEETQRLEGWTAFDENALGLSNIDLSLSFSPGQNPSPQPTSPVRRNAPSSTRPPISSSRRPTPSRPNTYPPQPPRSILRSRAPPIPEDLTFDDPSLFLTSTPMPPRASTKPGYLKTPSKRSVVRNKRPELFLPGSPEKRDGARQRDAGRVLGSMSAPPVPLGRPAADGGDKVTSFERRLALGGFAGGSDRNGGAGVKGKGRERAVGFGDVSHFG
ncbi:Sfi1-domain-containing protein [Periconia macrospinosa]|uniref:Sfi1-domain-containing protein n=1 Tax=Periconia macrospinosa TaxID=97972 RepID=A0A2V1E0J7_9PLEO|nr:Sfi1-domain-containing protein [Periconia macrospinosa]